jgi:ubiquitin-protein ligase
VWYRDERWKARLVAERLLMQERFPQFILQQTDEDTLRWVGILEPVEGQPFAVSLAYPARYPYNAPVFRVEAPALSIGCPHLYADGSLCVHKSWDSDRATAASCVPLICAWLVAYLHWLETGETF